MRLVMSVLLVSAVASACSSTLEPATLDGKWTQTSTVPGNSFDMTLATSGLNVSGSGEWCGEALGCGTLTVTGAVNGDAIHLDIVLNTGVVDHFDGRINLFGTLEGSLLEVVPGGLPQLPHGASYRKA
jgi:hypothetical protein